MRLRLFFLSIVCFTFCIGGSAQAKKHRIVLAPECNVIMPCEGGFYSVRAKHFVGIPFGTQLQSYSPLQRKIKQIVPVRRIESADSKPPGCPHAWCGCYMAFRKGLHDTRLNLARNWASLYGSPTSPQSGAVVVWRHHVGELVRHVRGDIWLVHSGNDGHAVKTRPRSISGAIAFRL